MKEHAEEEPTPRERQLLERCRQYEQQLQAQANQLAEFKAVIEAQREELERLKDTIAYLKGHSGRPKIKPSQLEKGQPGQEPGAGSSGQERKRAGSAKCQKTAHLKIDQTQIIGPEQVPTGSVFKGYQDYVVQELEMRVHTTRYRCERGGRPQRGGMSWGGCRRGSKGIILARGCAATFSISRINNM